MAFSVFRSALSDLQNNRVPLEKLVVTSRVSHELDSYRSPTPAARAALQLRAQTGKQVRPGQKMRFLYTSGEPAVRAWELSGQLERAAVDKVKYIELLARAAASVFHPFGIADAELKQWAHRQTIAIPLSFAEKRDYVWQIHDYDRAGGVASAIEFGGTAG